MKKTNTTKSVRKETVNTNVNAEAEVKETANEAKAITIKDPDAKATRAQLQLIGHAVKQGKIERFSEDAWENLTKGQAAEIISKNFADGIPASDAQKQKVSELVRNGWIKGMKAESFKNLSSDFAKTLIFKGQQNEAAGTKVEGWEERIPLAKDAPMTDRQKERITQLVKDGFLNRFNNKFFKSMTHEIASKFIGLGKSRQANGEKAPVYVKPRAFFYFTEKFSYAQNGSGNLKMVTIFLATNYSQKTWSAATAVLLQVQGSYGTRCPGAWI